MHYDADVYLVTSKWNLRDGYEVKDTELINSLAVNDTWNPEEIWAEMFRWGMVGIRFQDSFTIDSNVYEYRDGEMEDLTIFFENEEADMIHLTLAPPRNSLFVKNLINYGRGI